MNVKSADATHKTYDSQRKASKHRLQSRVSSGDGSGRDRLCLSFPFGENANCIRVCGVSVF